MAETNASGGVAGMKRRISVMLAIAGAAILLAGIVLASREIWFQFFAARTTGSYTDSHGEIDRATKIPRILYIVRFTDARGQKVEFMDQLLGEPLPEKTPLPVFYDPNNPKIARFVTAGRWELATQLLAAGMVFSVCGAGIRFLGRKTAVLTPDTVETPVTPVTPLTPVA
ncbi:MAG: hypothetical protein SFU56_15590 [Capsulimonadales bacterium]|nr:hypothetical protein [Capsulimonadales bacterium]